MAKFNSVVEILQQRVQDLADTPAFIFRDAEHKRSVLSWSTLYRLSGRFAAMLRQGASLSSSEGGGEARCGRGTLVVDTLPNSPERVVCEVGVMMTGGACVNGQRQMADGSDLLRTIRQSRATILLVDPDLPDSPWHILKDMVVLDFNNNVTSNDIPDLKKVCFIRHLEGGEAEDFLGLLETLDDHYLADDVNREDVMNIFTTSGSTGFSKLVVQTHGNYLAILEEGGAVPGVISSKDDRPKEFNIAPLGWFGGCVASVIAQGHTRVLCDVRARGTPSDMNEFIWKSIQEERCNRTALSPIYLPGLAHRMQEESKPRTTRQDPQTHSNLWKLGLYVLSGFPVKRSMVPLAFSIADKVFIAYGATDFGFVSAMMLDADGEYQDHDTGPLMKRVQVKITSREDENQTVAANQTGFILVKCPYVMKGYLNDPEATAAAFTFDGWFRTGDVGFLDERGHLFVEGRGSDAIMKGSYVIYPFWLELRILGCPGVKQVVIVGVHDPIVHEEICACLVLESDDVTIDDVRRWVEQEIVTSDDNPLSPRPRYYLKFESVPTTSTDKPWRKKVKEMAAQLLGIISA